MPNEIQAADSVESELRSSSLDALGRPMTTPAERGKCRLCARDIKPYFEICEPCVWEIALGIAARSDEGNGPTDALSNGCPPADSASPKTPDGHPLGAATGSAS